MKKWWIMVATVMAAVLILAVCLYGLPFDLPAAYPSGTGNSQLGTGNSQLGTTQPPETTEETLPWRTGDPIDYKAVAEPVSDYEIMRQVIPETVDNPDGLPVLKWVCMLSASNQILNEAAVVELNEMLADRNLPYRVQFTILSTRRHNNPQDWFAHPDVLKEMEDADLIYSNYTYTDMVQWLVPITDHIYGDAQPALADILPDKRAWFIYEADGEIYGIPFHTPNLYTQGWYVDDDFMKKYDLAFEDFNRNFWEMDELFAEIYEKNGNQPFIYNQYFGSEGGLYGRDGVLSWLPMWSTLWDTPYQALCLCFAIDLQAEKPTVVNMLETELFTKTLDAALRYLKAGYVSDKCDEIRQEGLISSSEPYLNESGEFWLIPNGPMVMEPRSNYPVIGISAKSVHQEQALSLLERIMSDDALRLQLCFGKEGRDYTLDEGNVYSLITQEDGSYYYMDYLSPQARFFEFNCVDQDTGLLVRSTSYHSVIRHEGMTRLESYQADWQQVSFSYCPVVFDYSVIDAELTAIGQVMGDYYPMFTYKDRYLEEYYPKMLQKLEEAGMSTVIAELQRQLDAWIAEHPDWDPLERS